jgi:hypothetical protein
MRNFRFLVVAVASLAAVLLLSGCTPNPEPTNTNTNTNTNTATNSATPTPTPTPVDFTFYYAADTPQGFKLFPEIHEIDDSSQLDVGALNGLVSGSEPPHDPDYRSLWGSGSTVNSVTIVGDTATVDLSLGTISLGADAEAVAISQIVWTLTKSNSTITKVRLTVDGLPVETIAGHVDATQIFKRGYASNDLNPVTISQPIDGQNIMGEVKVKGMACVFEATIAWELLQNGEVIESGSTLASEACPKNSPWSLNLGNLATGSYTFRGFALSPKDGLLLAEDTKDFTVTN